jgi:phosphatidylglycerol:prolipoprotein diacylglycerol transferase
MIYYEAIDPVVLSLGPINLYWYGLMYIFAFAGCYAVAWRHNKARSFLSASSLEDLLIYVALGVVLGGRVGYCLFYGLGTWIADPLWVFRIWEGGMSFHGGLLGVFTALFLFTRKYGIHYGDCLDFVAVCVPVGIFCGRIGNFINQELWGRPSDLPWSVVFSSDPDGIARHPSQLYEAGLEGLALFILLKYCYALKLPRWGVSAWFALGYGVARFTIEWLREPDAPMWLWMTRGQLLCLPLIALGMWWIIMLKLNPSVRRS